MMRALVFFVLVIFFGLRSSAQELVFSEPIKLSSNVNSEDEELGVVLSSDGKTMYFSRAFHDKNRGGKYAGTDIWMSKKDAEGNWMPAANVGSPWNNKQSNSVIGVNQDNTVVYLLNAYSNKSGIAFSKLINGTWTDPEVIPLPGINRNDFVGFYVNPAFDVILISMKGADSFGEEDLYVSLKDASEKWTEPKNLGPTINTKGFEISPFLSSDKKRLFFSSNGHGGYGDADIFVCDRLFDSWETWSVPKNLGDRINFKKFDADFYETADSTITFVSNRLDGASDIYVTSFIAPGNQKKDTTEVIYLNDEEVFKIFGRDFIVTIEFEKNSSLITPKYQLRIKELSLILNANKSLKLRLVARREPNSTTLEINKFRLINILEDFKKSGVEGGRITFGSEIIKEFDKEKEGIVVLKFYR